MALIFCDKGIRAYQIFDRHHNKVCIEIYRNGTLARTVQTIDEVHVIVAKWWVG